MSSRVHTVIRSGTLMFLSVFTLALSAGQPAVVKDKAIVDALLGEEGSRGIGVEVRPVSLQIQFELNSSVLRADADAQLAELWKALNDSQLSSVKIEISGHTDATGSDAVNLQLSERRAGAVRDYLLRKGGAIQPAKLMSVGYGESRLLPDLRPEDPLNRRVEVRIVQ